MALKILVVDDEPDLVELIEYNISQHGHTVVTAGDGARALELAKEQVPDLVVLDVMMPRLNGTEVAKRLRSQTETASIPIIMLTAKAEEADELEGLGAGADDYITKPFSMQILLARIEALARRTSGSAQESTNITLGPITIDLVKHQTLVDGQPISLTITEFRLLSTLLSEPGQVLTRQALISAAIGPGVAVTARTIDVHITAIRRKLKPYSKMISTVRSVGYRADAPVGAETE
jgi:two-component system phosphate regulon response regulator PhoB